MSTNSTEFETRLEITCGLGWKIPPPYEENDMSTECQANGTWSRIVPDCIGKLPPLLGFYIWSPVDQKRGTVAEELKHSPLLLGSRQLVCRSFQKLCLITICTIYPNFCRYKNRSGTPLPVQVGSLTDASPHDPID